MLSDKEKKEMLLDARSKRRRENFRFVRTKGSISYSLDEFISFLNSVQRIFGPFKISKHPTITKFNKL